MPDPAHEVLFNYPFTREQYNCVINGTNAQLIEEADAAVTRLRPFDNPRVLRGFLGWTQALTAATERAIAYSHTVNEKYYENDTKAVMKMFRGDK